MLIKSDINVMSLVEFNLKFDDETENKTVTVKEGDIVTVEFIDIKDGNKELSYMMNNSLQFRLKPIKVVGKIKKIKFDPGYAIYKDHVVGLSPMSIPTKLAHTDTFIPILYIDASSEYESKSYEINSNCIINIDLGVIREEDDDETDTDDHSGDSDGDHETEETPVTNPSTDHETDGDGDHETEETPVTNPSTDHETDGGDHSGDIDDHSGDGDGDHETEETPVTNPSTDHETDGGDNGSDPNIDDHSGDSDGDISDITEETSHTEATEEDGI